MSKQVCHPKLYSRVVCGLSLAVSSSYTWVVIEETKRKSSCKLCSINHFLYDFLPLFGSFSLPLDLGNLERKAIYFSRSLSTNKAKTYKFHELTPYKAKQCHFLINVTFYSTQVLSILQLTSAISLIWSQNHRFANVEIVNQLYLYKSLLFFLHCTAFELNGKSSTRSLCCRNMKHCIGALAALVLK